MTRPGVRRVGWFAERPLTPEPNARIRRQTRVKSALPVLSLPSSASAGQDEPGHTPVLAPRVAPAHAPAAESRVWRAAVGIWLLFAVVVIVSPLVGWPRTLRGSVVLGVPLLVTWLAAKPWAWREEDWRRLASFEPSHRHVAIGAALAGLFLAWVVVTLFQGGHINGVDFTIYFDRPLYQTIQGRPLFVESTDDPAFAYVTHLGVHAYWLLLPLAGLYRIWPSPYWLLLLSAGAVVAGSVYVLRIGRHAHLGGLLSCAAAIAVLVNDNTARALRYGFHPEVLYVWFVPWLVYAGLRGRRWSFAAAAFATVMVKEGAIMPLFAGIAVLAIMRGRTMNARERVFYLAMPLVLASVNLAVFYTYVVPVLWPHPGIAYANFWSNYGPTPLRAVAGMALNPLSVARDVWTSGLFTVVLPPFLFLPLVGWRWSIGTLPLVVIFAASANDQVRAFGIYYAIYLVPFFALAAADGARALVGRVLPGAKAVPVAAALVVIGALVIGPGYALRSWRAEVAAVASAIELLGDEKIVLVQSSLYPHAGYDARVQLLTPRALADPANRNAAVLIAPDLRRYPFADAEFARLLVAPSIREVPGGLSAVRNNLPAAR